MGTKHDIVLLGVHSIEVKDDLENKLIIWYEESIN